MKIVGVDNFNRDNVSDFLVCENVDEYWAEIICEELNNKLSGETSREFFMVKEDDYKLYEVDY